MPESIEDDGEQKIWSWGAGTDGQLCTGKLNDENLPQLLYIPSLFSSGAISTLSCGGAHVIALSSSGKVLTWGRGNSGQLGLGHTTSSLHPQPVTALKSFVITHVSAGWSHSGFVSDEGKVYSCGDGSFGQLGHGDFRSNYLPVESLFFADKQVCQIACGMRHSLVLVKGGSGGRVYGFGAGKRGQLGISKRIQSANLPLLSSGLEDVEIVGIDANGDHSTAISAEGRLYTWGRGFDGASDSYAPQRLDSSLCFRRAAVGWNHAIVLTDEGDLYMLGGKHHGALGHSGTTNSAMFLPDDRKEENCLRRVSGGGVEGMKIMEIGAGAEHSAIVTEDGEIKTWGWGEHGQLGLGDSSDHTFPQSLTLLHNSSHLKVFCGSGFTISLQHHLPHFNS